VKAWEKGLRCCFAGFDVEVAKNLLLVKCCVRGVVVFEVWVELGWFLVDKGLK
jgi:hypothetical protein